jgi:hypothetical protein
MDPIQDIEVSRWWNGWDWVSVFGRDDSTHSTSASETYRLFDHPATSYLYSGFTGNSSDLLPTQSEIALHFPHEYRTWGHKSWSEAVASADSGHDMLEGRYEFASRWDDPNYVGVGDTYISLANPGNTASWEMMYAQMLRGTRIMGTSSWTYLGGNGSLIGSYWLYTYAQDWIPTWGSWHPHQKADLMDMLRVINTDVDNTSQINVVKLVAENSGVVRFYNHDVVANTTLLYWVTNPKTDFSFENWKATDGEVASYINGRWGMDARLDPASSANSRMYDVSRKDPISDGYWRVPVTLALDITDKSVVSVRVVSGGWDLNSSAGTFKDLHGSREMDIGYDVRGNKLYVSYFWNESSRLEVNLKQLYNPRISAEGVREGLAYQEYSSTINCTPPDSGASAWLLESDAAWLGIEASNDTACVVSGVPMDWGIFEAKVTVSDNNNSDTYNWSITITRLKVVTGRILNETSAPIPGLLVTVVVKNGQDVRTEKTNTTDANGTYAVTFTNDEWFVGDTIVVSANHENRTEDNSSLATTELEQQIDLQFVPVIPEFGVMEIALAASAVCITVAAVALYWRRKRKVSDA